MPFDPAHDLAPITLLAGVPNVLVMKPGRAKACGIATVPDLVRYAESHPGKLTLAPSRNGTSLP